MKKFYAIMNDFFKDKTYKKYLTYFLIIVMCMSVISVISYAVNYRKINVQIENNNYLAVKRTSLEIDAIFNDIQNVFRTTDVMDNDIQVENGEYKTKEKIKTYVDRLANIIMQKQYVEDIILIYKDTNLAMTSKGTVDIDLLFNTVYYNPQINATKWKSIIRSQHNVKFLRSMEFIDRSAGYEKKRNLVTIIDSNVLGYKNDINKIIIIDEKKALAPIISTDDSQQRIVTVYDASGNYLMGDMADSLNISDLLMLKIEESEQGYVHEGKAYFVQSEYNRFIYEIIPQNIPTKGESSSVLLWSFVVTIFLGVVLAFLFAYYLNRPLRNIMSNIAGQEVVVDNTVMYIADKVAQMQEENVENINTLTKMSSQIVNSVFLKLTSSSSYYHNNKNYIETVFPCIANEKSILLFGIHMGNRKNGAGVFISSMAKSCNLSEEHFIMIDEDENTSVLMIGFDKDKIGKTTLVRHMMRHVKHISDKYSVFVSNVYASLSDMYEAYTDIKICMEYHVVGAYNDNVDIEKINPEIKVYLPDDIKNKIYNYLLTGQKKECIEIVNSVIDVNIENGIYYIKFKLLVHTLSNIIFEALFECKYDNVNVLFLERSLDKRLLKSNTLDVNSIKNILANVIRMSVDEKRTEKSSKLNKTDVINYINSHYHEDLHLEKMSEIFGTTPKYFSNFFSRGGNESFIEYLTKVRISKAKELLAQSNMKITDIAAKVGYASTATFTNTFKKFTGISPSVFREIHLNQKEE